MAKRYGRQKDVWFIEMKTVGGAALFSQPMLAGKLVDGLKWCCEHRGLRIYDYAILPDRVLFMGNTTWGNLDDVIHSFRSFSSKAVIRILRSVDPRSDAFGMMSVILESARKKNEMLPQIWQDEMTRNQLFRQEDIDGLSQKIKNMPVEMGCVIHPEDYRLSSACPIHPLEGWVLEAVDRWR
jgi:hypothetical protein